LPSPSQATVRFPTNMEIGLHGASLNNWNAIGGFLYSWQGYSLLESHFNLRIHQGHLMT
jgi:hypothetical protein